jgi:polysaccharide biosynthesis/export protein
MFDTQAALLRGQLDLLRSQKPRLQKEIEALQEQITTETRQLQLIREQIERYDRLVKQGLGTQNAKFQFTVIEANQESSIWRLKAGISRLQMDAGELDLKIEEAEASLKKQAVIELREVRDRLSELEVSLPAARELRDVKLQYIGGFANVGLPHTISITRVESGQQVVIEANEYTTLVPGDIVDVKRLIPSRLPAKSARSDEPGPGGLRDNVTHAAETADHVVR